jgi:hypothetical protein
MLMAEGEAGTQSCTYKDCKIEIMQAGVSESLAIDGKSVDYIRDPDCGAYLSPDAPYRVYGSLEELGKGIVDVRSEHI